MSTRGCDPRHGLLHHISSKSVALHDLTHMLLLLALQDSQKVTQLGKTKGIPLWREVSHQKQLAIRFSMC